ncbi:hypothetical protein [Streptomyces indicus]|uniref:MarR family transcriptional regulator n=1 Tax=Streptomyces indicus TaxID=417292 RepID=A0A1G9IV01_9ACTN|nr:hypothetical protein [Streptomyces indicus]SDL28865.1 hypothetical protein SAMN05421806_12578 [Streptomyces indicus]
MTRKLSVAERLASTEKDALLDDISKHSEWDRFLVEQAVLHFGESRIDWSCNDIRDLLPDLGPGLLGAVINSLRTAGVIAHTGLMVPSTQANTHGHRIAVWVLTPKGLAIAAKRRAARADQQRRAA